MKPTRKHTLPFKACALILFGAATLAQAPEKAASAMLEGISKEHRVIEKAIVIQMKDQGQRFLFSVDGSKPRVLEYGEVVRLESGFKKASFKSRGRSVVIVSDDESPADYSVSEVIDTRSMGGERKHETRRFKIVDGRMLDSTPTKSEEQNKAQHPTDGAPEPEKPKE